MRKIKALVAILLASTLGTLPSCGTMGGGMRYLMDRAPAPVITG